MADIEHYETAQAIAKKAKAAANKVAKQFADQYDMESEWDGDVLIFKRSGVSGTLEVHATEATLEITLGFLFKAFASKIEAHIHKNMDKVRMPCSFALVLIERLPCQAARSSIPMRSTWGRRRIIGPSVTDRRRRGGRATAQSSPGARPSRRAAAPASPRVWTPSLRRIAPTW